MPEDKKESYPVMTKQVPSVDFQELGKLEWEDMITLIWDENDRIHHICKEGEQQLLLKTADYKKNSIKWTSLFDEDFVHAVHDHFSRFDETLHVENVTLNPYLNQRDAYQAEITMFTIEDTLYYIGYFKNKLSMKAIQKNLADNDKLLTTSWLSAGLVHEIRNPLTSLKGFLQLVQAGITQKEEYYQVMIKEVEKLETITNELLLIAKPDETERQKESVNQLIEDVVFIMSTQVDLRAINFDLHVENDLYILCRASQIKQVLINVIKNSVEAMHYEGVIQIEAYEANQEVHLLIKDEGEGLQTEQIKEIKTPFYTTKPSGTGLGLVITNHILQEHDGGFSVEPNEQQGMTVTIHLPSTQSL